MSKIGKKIKSICKNITLKLENNSDIMALSYKWKDENERYKDYWFAIYAYVLVRGDEVYCTQKGIYARTNIEEYILPKDQELFPGETYDINEEYLLYMDKAAFGGGQYITFPIWGVEVQTIEEKDKDPALEET